MRKRPGFWVYHDLYYQMMDLRFDYEQIGRLTAAMFHYSVYRMKGREYIGLELKNAYGEFEPKLLEAFKCFQKDFDEDSKKVKEKSERMQRNGRKGGKAKAKKLREKKAGESG